MCRRVDGGGCRRRRTAMLSEIRNLGAARQHLRDERGERSDIAVSRGTAAIFDRNEGP